MIKLFIDTATSRLIVGIYKDNKELYLENVEAHNDLSSRVLPTIKKICEEVNIKINDVDEIYVVNGPGSFTGIRVGVTIAKTLAWSLNKKIYTVSELQLQASCGKSKYIVPMIDARRGYVYAGVYNKNLKSIIPVVMRVSEVLILDSDARKVFDAECQATDIFALSLENPQRCGGEYTFKLIKDDEDD